MKILFSQDGYIVGVTDEGKYFETYKNLNNINILNGAALYIQQLEQQNEQLKTFISNL